MAKTLGVDNETWKNIGGGAATAANPVLGGAAWYFSDEDRRKAFDSGNPMEQFDNWLRGGAPERQRKAQEAIQEIYDGMAAPVLQDVDFKQQGSSAYEQIQSDPRLRQAQMMALQDMMDRVDAGGLTDVDKARIAETMGKYGTASRGSQEAIIADAQRRGVGGSGLEMMSRMRAEQGAAERANQEGLQTNALAQQARQAALDSLMSGSSSVRGQDYNEEARKAAARDEINRFNVGIANQGQVMNRVTLPQSRFGNQMTVNDRRAGALAGGSALQGQLGNQTVATTGQVLDATGKVVSTVVGGGVGGMAGAAAGAGAHPVTTPGATPYGNPNDPYRYR